MVSTRRQLEDLLVDYSHRIHARGWVANHDGNITARLAEDRWLATPTSVSKAAVTRESLLVVDGRGERVSGRTKVFSELALHLLVYRRRPDVRAVLHAHPPCATGLAVAGMAPQPSMLAEPVVSLGATIPLVPYAPPKTAEFTLNLLPHVDEADVCVLEHHGVMAMGPDVETAYLRMELVEHLARIQLAAIQAGALRTIPDRDVDNLLRARAQAGLGRAAGRPRQIGLSGPASQVTAMVAEEVKRVLTQRAADG
jgi:L-fuculose-phosphate aldolase